MIMSTDDAAVKWFLYEYDTGHEFGPASEEHRKKWEAALSRGAAFFLYPYCGYELRMTVAPKLKRLTWLSRKYSSSL